MNDLDKYLEMCFEGQTGFVYVALKNREGTWKPEFFSWPAQEEMLRQYIFTATLQLEVYMSPAIFRTPSAKKNSVKGSQVVWVEFDGDSGINLNQCDLPKPSLVLQSSLETHQHIYWKVPFSTPEVIEEINKKLTYTLEADSSGWDANQVLRPPMTHNHKRDLPVKVVSKFGGEVLDLDKFAHLKEVPAVTTAIELATLPDPQKVMSGHVWSSKLYNLLHVEIPVEGLRSHFLMHLGYEMAGKGLNLEEIVSLLRIPDERIGKFIGRSDRLIRLAEIAARALQEYTLASQLEVFNVIQFAQNDISFNSVWGNLLPDKGNILLAGAPGVGKTQLSLHAAIEMCLGRELHGLEVPETGIGKAFFSSMEMPEAGFQWLVRQQLAGFTDEQKAKLADSLFVAAPGMSLRQDELASAIKTLEPDGVFYDSLSSIIEGDMTSESEARKLLDFDARLRRDHDLFTWFIHHNRKAKDDKEPITTNEIYGSYLFAAKIDTILSFYKWNNQLKIYAVKSRYAKESSWLVERNSDLTFKKVADVDLDKTGHATLGKGNNLSFK